MLLKGRKFFVAENEVERKDGKERTMVRILRYMYTAFALTHTQSCPPTHCIDQDCRDSLVAEDRYRRYQK